MGVFGFLILKLLYEVGVLRFLEAVLRNGSFRFLDLEVGLWGGSFRYLDLAKER